MSVVNFITQKSAIVSNILGSYKVTRVFLLTLVLSVVSACTTTYTSKQLQQDKNERSVQLESLNSWTIKGKIAFIQPNDKQSANIYWQQSPQHTQLKLTTFLGVNVLTLTSNENQHSLTVDGKTYHDSSLENLLLQTTGLQLPVHALIYWVKGLKASNNDIVYYSDDTQLPSSIDANINDLLWRINYQSYGLYGDYRLANKLSIEHDDLTIKLAINRWELNK